jgi:hypothetical protein
VPKVRGRRHHPLTLKVLLNAEEGRSVLAGEGLLGAEHGARAPPRGKEHGGDREAGVLLDAVALAEREEELEQLMSGDSLDDLADGSGDLVLVAARVLNGREKELKDF